ncbi:Alpha/Beta hydrolase protein [Pseudomassariella vexata]|uniref:Alpha/Beta hydrolase protein n=1 Tax=Pseudomassariella vexata TaxID=1141098 RepID=A0A1Y2EID7_9PEZI|nr:Alpha/Beta hydrolase protein [Pseudomassariella vexata]ORY71342.1 Alpha/Beta hydrolase protein [Pseudomassariella vexata]
MWTSLLLLPGLLCLTTAVEVQIVQTLNGTIQGGKCITTDANYFFSIPYATPPVRKLRYAAPRSYTVSFNRTLNATTAARSCIQFGTSFIESNVQSEDCLYLNIWTPTSATPDSNLPVRAWLYGGSKEAGGISNQTYTGCFSVADAVVVSINYRMGPWGFLPYRAKVLLYGESAGATDTFVLASLPSAPRLMRAAALEFGAGRNLSTVGEAQAWQETFLGALNCTPVHRCKLTAHETECVRAASPSDLQAAVNSMPEAGVPGTSSLLTFQGSRDAWGPLVDGSLIPISPSAAGVQVPSIIGSNSDEGTLFILNYYGASDFLNESAYDTFLSHDYGPLTFKTVLMESRIKCPTHRALKKAVENKVPVWSYEFKHVPSCAWFEAVPQTVMPLLGATHTAEIPFVSNMTDHLPSPEGNCRFRTEEKALVGAMNQAWTVMAKYGRPDDETVACVDRGERDECQHS